MLRPTTGTALFALAAAPVLAQEPTPTFTEDVAPIVFERCAACHRPGEVAPFPLLTHRDAVKKGRLIKKVVERRDMPPWHPVEGHGEFSGSLRLSDEEIATIVGWVEGGMPEGPPDALPPLPEFTDGWQLGEPDLVVTMPEGFEVPAGGPDIYRSFVIPLDLPEDRYVTAIEVRPSARSVLHHIVFGLDTSGSAREVDGSDGQPGFDGMRSLGRSLRRGEDAGGLGSGSFGGWAVGGMPQHLPDGLATRLPAGADLILNSHFHPSGKAEVEKTTIGLHFAEEPPTRSLVGLQLPPLFGIAAGIDIPPGEARYTIRDAFTLPIDVEAVSVGGHAHSLCKEMRVWVTRPEGERESVFWIDDWDFDWQNRYQYAQPVPLPKGTKVEVELTYDNSENNPNNPFSPPRRVRWGRESTDEMGSVTMLLVARDEADAPELRDAIRGHVAQSFRGRGARSGMASALASRIRGYDADGDGVLREDEIPARLRARAKAFDVDGDGELDAEEIDALIERLGGGRGR